MRETIVFAFALDCTGVTKTPRDLQKEILESTSLINAKDVHGRTALSWAAQRRDSQAIDTLLGFRADPNIADRKGRTALLYAATTSSQCLRLLLISGRNPNCKDNLSATPLHYATNCNNMESAEMLLQYGAEVNVANVYKLTPLFYACKHSASNIVRLLLSYSASSHIKSSDSGTILHAIARVDSPDISLILSLAKLDWQGVDVDTKSVFTQTAREIVSYKFDPPDVLRAYEALFSKVEADNGIESSVCEVIGSEDEDSSSDEDDEKEPGPDEVVESEDEDSVFEDAVEDQ